MEREKRNSGRTTRLADKYIQDLFTNEIVKIVDHTNNYESNKRLLDLIVLRLASEHNVKISIDVCDLKIKLL